MAALRKLSQQFLGAAIRRNPSNISVSPSSDLLPALLIPRRGIVSKLFVGGLSYYTTETLLSEAFSEYGQVVDAKIVMDRVSDRSKGFGFVTFASEDEAERAISEMDGKTLSGRRIFVNYAKPKTGSDLGIPIARGPPESAPGESGRVSSELQHE